MESTHPEYHYLVNQIPGLTEEQKAAFARKAKSQFQRISDRLAQLVAEDVQDELQRPADRQRPAA
jgi:hypothetical protein